MTVQPENSELNLTRPQLFQSWVRFLSKELRPFHDHVFEPSLFIATETLDRAAYLAHFAHQPFSVASFDGSFHQHVTPAACLHVYENLADRDIGQYRTLGMAHCARYENGQWDPPYRRPDFFMLELVTLGDRALIEERVLQMRSLVSELLKAVQLDGSFKPATDAFFLGEDEGAKRMQQLKGLKHEFVVQDDGHEVALSSINNHEDFFGQRFNIRNGSEPVHSCCVAFGIDRLCDYSLKRWGPDPSAWPDAFTA
jgi:hypothetical protein